MPSPMSFLDPNSPQVRALMERNPNGVFAMMLKNAWKRTGAAPSDNAAGSNNAGGLFPGPTTATSNRPSFAAYSGNSNGLLGPMVNAMGQYSRRGPGGYTISGGDQGANNNGSNMGGGPVSFAAGGMMTAQGTAVRPGEMMGNMTPAAGTGRTLPSARFKVEAQAPTMPNAPMVSGMQDQPQLGAASPAPLDPAQIEQEAQRFVQQHPEEAQKIQGVIALTIQTGQLTSQELNTAIQLAKTALANPNAYPQIRQFAIKNGLGTEQDIPEQMDQGILFVLILAGKTSQAVGPQGNAMAGQGPAPTMENGVLPEYKNGGMTGDTAHLAKVHPREYVIPEDTLIYHGKKHFDKLVEQARTPPDANKAN